MHKHLLNDVIGKRIEGIIMQDASKVSCFVQETNMVEDCMDSNGPVVGSLSKTANHLLDIRLEDVVVAEKEDIFSIFSMVFRDGEELPSLSGTRNATQGYSGCDTQWTPLPGYFTVIRLICFKHLLICFVGPIRRFFSEEFN